MSDNSLVISFKEFNTKTGGCLDALDVTPEVEELVRTSGVRDGNVLVFSPHTTCCVLVAPAGQGTVKRIEQMMQSLAPEDGYYAHDDLDIRTENLVEEEPPNAPAHIAHVFMGKASETLPVVDGRLQLGTDQRVLFVELDCSRNRRYCVQVIGE